MQWHIHAGKTFGQIPFRRLFLLGVDRDNDLPLRAHVGTRHGQKGSAPLGRNYFLSNWESDKHVYAKWNYHGEAGPFLDTGKILDHRKRWVRTSGSLIPARQAKLNVLGVGVVLLYGKTCGQGTTRFTRMWRGEWLLKALRLCRRVRAIVTRVCSGRACLYIQGLVLSPWLLEMSKLR